MMLEITLQEWLEYSTPFVKYNENQTEGHGPMLEEALLDYAINVFNKKLTTRL